MSKKKPEITEVTRRFNETVERLINKGLVDSYKSVADQIGWRESDLSSARKENINVPPKYVKSLEDVFKVKIITQVDDQIIGGIMERLLRLEANTEVLESVRAELMAKANKKSFSESLSELRSLVKEAVNRRFEGLSK